MANLKSVDDYMFDDESKVENLAPQKVKFKLVLTLNSDTGSTSIGVGPCEVPSDCVEDLLKKHIGGAYFTKRLRAALGQE